MKSGLLRNIASHYLGLFVAGTANFLLVPVLLHHLGSEGYGILALCLSSIVLLQILEFGMANAAVKYVAEWKADNNVRNLQIFYKSSLIVFTALGLFGGLILAGLTPWLPGWLHVNKNNLDAARYSLLWAAAALFISFPNMILKSYLVGKQRYDLSNACETTMMLLYAGSAAVLTFAGSSVVSVIAAYAISSLCVLILLLVLVHREFPELKNQLPEFQTTIFQQTWQFSFWNFVRNIASRISWDLDTFIIGTFLSAGSVTPYVVGRKLPYMYSSVCWRWVDVFFPLSSQMTTDGRQEDLRMMFIRATRWCLAISIAGALTLIFLARPLLVLWLGDITQDSVTVQKLVTFSLFLDLSHSVSTTMLAGAGKLKRISQYFFAEAVLNVSLSLILVRSLGIVGVALGTAISSCLTVLFFQIPYACRTFQISVSQYVREVWVPQLYPGVVAIVLLLVSGRYTNGISIAGGLLAMAAYAVIFWYFGASLQDRASFREMLRTSSAISPVKQIDNESV